MGIPARHVGPYTLGVNWKDAPHLSLALSQFRSCGHRAERDPISPFLFFWDRTLPRELYTLLWLLFACRIVTLTSTLSAVSISL